MLDTKLENLSENSTEIKNSSTEISAKNISKNTTPLFIHLRCHSHYSLLKSLPQIKALVKKAKECNMPALALTDYNNMYGAIEFYNECKKQNIKAILGAEIDYTLNNNLNSKKYKLVFLVKDNLGYKILMRLVSEANLYGKKEPHLTKELLLEILNNYSSEDFSKKDLGLILLSGDIDGEISEALAKADFAKAKNIFSEYEEIFGKDNFYLEISCHIKNDYGREIRQNTAKFVAEILKDKNKLIATQNPHYLREEDKPAHKILFAIHGEEADMNVYNSKFKSEDYSFWNTEMAQKNFQDIKINFNIDVIANTNLVTEKINLVLQFGKWYFTDISMDFKKELESGQTFDDILKHLAYKGVISRGLEGNDEVMIRLNYELEIIKKKGYASYFLVVYDMLLYAKENGILTNIRGSVAGSMTTYVLYITKMNPLIYKLPFERFLNPDRPSAPDIDMDYADDRREEMITYITQKYGREKVAQIGTFGTMLARGAVRDVARAMKFPYTLGDQISKLIPMPKQGFPVFIDKAIQEVEDLKKKYTDDRDTQIILDMAKKVEGMVRHIGVHAAGLLIAPAPIWEFTPIQQDPKGEGKIISQYDMYSVTEDNVGLLKFDILGIRNLTILKTSINLVKEKYNLNIDIEEINMEDKKTFEMLARGETMGIFQLNGSGMTKFLKALKPNSIFDINAMVALYRPGPIETIPDYIARKHNPKLINYLDERLKNILDQSYGVLVYQDDVMMTAIHLAGYSWLEADKLRKAMGKKIPEEMHAQKEKLIQGLLRNGLAEEKAKKLWEKIEPFAAYGFNKAHAASYGRVSYQTAFMKANYPVAFMTAILSEESGDIDKISEIVTECQRMKIEILPPNVNYSFGGFTIVENLQDEKYQEAIRFGLYTIKNLGTKIADAIIQEREKNGKYKNLEDFINRITHKDLNKKSLESLIMCGGMDEFGERGLLLNNVDQLLEYQKTQIKQNQGQESLFDNFSSSISFTLLSAAPATPSEKLTWEKELLGLYISGSPLDPWKEKIQQRQINIKNILEQNLEEKNQTPSQINSLRRTEEKKFEIKENQNITLPCLIENIKVTKTKNGEFMAIIKISDYTGRLEAAIFPKTYKVLKNKILLNIPIVISGKITTRNDEKTMLVDDINELR